MKEKINVLWFKRDLRILDNPSFNLALKEKNKLLLIYLFDDYIKDDPHFSNRHLRFIKESIIDLNNSLKKFDTKIHVYNENICNFIQKLDKYYTVEKIYSHCETGLKNSYRRDLEFKKFCDDNNLIWIESINNGVFRGLKSRKNWIKNWQKFVREDIKIVSPTKSDFLNIDNLIASKKLKINKNNSVFQKGGTTSGLRYLDSFLDDRIDKYQNNISKPELSRTSCSRLSPYISWGNLSVRYIWQRAKEKLSNGKSKFQINGFTSRLRWQAHFIQKFEMEHQMQFRSVNKGFIKLKKKINKTYIRAWKNAKTGYPLVDASMKCLIETGYLNFRMRAMLVSFLTHHLWQPWEEGVIFLANKFLDFEPGIHYSQFQMQAGETGINMIRIYNPTKNAKEHDVDGVFIKKWIPALKNIPIPLLYEPWKLNEIDQDLFKCKIGIDYPKPIVDISKTYKNAASQLWTMKNDSEVKIESKRILQKHTNSDRTAFDR